MMCRRRRWGGRRAVPVGRLRYAYSPSGTAFRSIRISVNNAGVSLMVIDSKVSLPMFSFVIIFIDSNSLLFLLGKFNGSYPIVPVIKTFIIDVGRKFQRYHLLNPRCGVIFVINDDFPGRNVTFKFVQREREYPYFPVFIFPKKRLEVVCISLAFVLRGFHE